MPGIVVLSLLVVAGEVLAIVQRAWQVGGEAAGRGEMVVCLLELVLLVLLFLLILLFLVMPVGLPFFCFHDGDQRMRGARVGGVRILD